MNMSSKIFFTLFLYLNCIVLAIANINDYINGIKSYFGYKQDAENSETEIYEKRIPYEVSEIDQSFLNEAAKLTGVALSELDSCQHRVVLKLQLDCDKLNDEQLAKMAVHLLNCQSFVEGRPLYPCTEEMNIKDCTINMDSDTWTSYHLMSNRARAVCYSIRQSQFRGLAEHTVNRLMDAAQQQLRTLGRISNDQVDIKNMADKTYSSLMKGHEILSKQHDDLQRAQFFGQLTIEDNIKRLADEKRLIRETHNNLVKMTERVQDKLELSLQQLEDQSDTSRSNHKELIEDLMAIQTKAKEIFERIDASSSLLIEQNIQFQKQYDSTFRSLKEVNETVHNLVSLIGGTRAALEEKLSWIKTALGGTDLAVERLYLVLWHSAFMLLAMLTCAFLAARPSTRFFVAILPPLNLSMALYEQERYLDPVSLAASIGAFVLVHTVVLYAISFKLPAKMTIENKHTPNKSLQMSTSTENYNYDKTTVSSSGHQATDRDDSYQQNSNYITSQNGSNHEELAFNETDSFKEYDFTPPVSRNGHYTHLPRSRSRSNTPLLLNTSLKSPCHAKTRVGTPCKLTSLPGRLYCYRHQSGDSVMG